MEDVSNSPNCFDALLSNHVLILTVVKMGVNIPDSDFTSIDVLRELEKFRNMESLEDKNEHPDLTEKPMLLTNAKGNQTPLNMNWGDENNLEQENFTVVKSRKKKEKKINVVISKPVTKSQKSNVSLNEVKVTLLCLLVGLLGGGKIM